MAVCVNHFARLGISIGADIDEVKKAYRTLAKKWHPDKNKDEGATEKFQTISASYEFLSSKDRREIHERELRNATKTATQVPQTKGESIPKTSNTSQSSTKKSGKASATSWSESFTTRWKEANSTKTFFFTEHNQPHRFAYASKEREEWDDPFLSTPESVFDIFFRRSEAGPTTRTGGAKVKKAPRQRHVAPETGPVLGLDKEYLFSPQAQPSSDGLEEKLPCPWCGGTFMRGKLFQHEEKCGKFGLSADEDEDGESDGDEGTLTQFRQPYSRSLPTWQQQHQQLISRVRRDKLNHRNQCASHAATK